jgi:hypothetical protein
VSAVDRHVAGVTYGFLAMLAVVDEAKEAVTLVPGGPAPAFGNGLVMETTQSLTERTARDARW